MTKGMASLMRRRPSKFRSFTGQERCLSNAEVFTAGHLRSLGVPQGFIFLRVRRGHGIDEQLHGVHGVLRSFGDTQD